MRLIRISAPGENGESITRLAFESGVASVSLQSAEKHFSDGRAEAKTIIDVETSTPKAHRFIRELLAADFFDPSKITVNVRQPRSILSRENSRDVTTPLEEPGPDLFQELWQFSHITYALVGRVLIAGGLIGYGLIGQHTLLIIGGLLFLPLLPLLMAIGFGALTRQWSLLAHGAAAFLLCTALLAVGGAAAATLRDPPMRYNDFSPFLVSLLISTGVGVAAGLASIDDVGRRELIGLAAAAQVGIIPVWLGVSLVLGTPPTAGAGDAAMHALSLLINTLAIIVAATFVHAATGVAKSVSFIPRS